MPGEQIVFWTVTGVVTPEGRLQRWPGFTTADPSDAGTDPESPLRAEMLARDGARLAEVGIPLDEPCADGPAPVAGVRVVAAKLAVPPGTVRVRFTLEGRVLEEFRRPAGVPVIGSPQMVHVGERWRVTWAADHPDGAAMSYLLSFSHDDGRSWRPLSLPIEATEAEVDVDALPGGERCMLRVTATDGLNTVERDGDPFRLPVRPCLAMILDPEEGRRVRANEVLRLRGQGYWREEGRPEHRLLTWESSLDGPLGAGPVVEAEGLRSGTHRITLMAGAGERVGRAQTTVIVERR